MVKAKYLVLLISVLQTLFSANAGASVIFGDDEHLRMIADIKLPGPMGQDMLLYRKITYKNFILPYFVVDNGFVIAERGSSKDYIPMPNKEIVQEAQRLGLMPNPLPGWKLSPLDWFIGLALWEFIAVTVILGLVQRAFRKRKTEK